MKRTIFLKPMALFMSLLVLCLSQIPVYAKENTVDSEQIIQCEELPDGWTVDENGNYSNASTGEYFRWNPDAA